MSEDEHKSARKKEVVWITEYNLDGYEAQKIVVKCVNEINVDFD